MLDFSIYAPFAISYDSCLLGTGLKPFLHGHRWHCLSKGMCRVGCFPRASIHTAGPLNSWEQHCWLGWLWSRAGSWPATGFIHPLPGMDQPQGPQSPDTTNGIELCPRSDWVSGKGCSPEDGQALAQAPQGSGHGPRLSEFKECLHSTLHTGFEFWVFLCRARSWTHWSLQVLSNSVCYMVLWPTSMHTLHPFSA